MTVRFATQANHFTIPGWEGRITPDHVVATALAQEEAGFDVVCLADFGRSELFPGLTLIAQATSRVEVNSRIMGVFGHSPTLLASGAAWVDAVSRGRFSLGLGASMPYMQDIPVATGATLFLATFFLLFSAAVDVLYAFLDPRLREIYARPA